MHEITRQPGSQRIPPPFLEKGRYIMTRLATAAAVLILLLSVCGIASNAEAKSECDGLAQADCAAKTACRWSEEKSECKEKPSEACHGLDKTDCTTKTECTWNDKKSKCEAKSGN
jgi:hypothetical protein